MDDLIVSIRYSVHSVVQNCGLSCALAVEMQQPGSKPLICNKSKSFYLIAINSLFDEHKKMSFQ